MINPLPPAVRKSRVRHVSGAAQPHQCSARSGRSAGAGEGEVHVLGIIVRLGPANRPARLPDRPVRLAIDAKLGACGLGDRNRGSTAWHPPQAASTKAGARVSGEGEVDLPTIGGGVVGSGALAGGGAASRASGAIRVRRWGHAGFILPAGGAFLDRNQLCAAALSRSLSDGPLSGKGAGDGNDRKWVGSGH